MKKTIAVLVGSLRKESFNRKLALEAMKLGSENFEYKLIEIGNLEHYNEDLETKEPPKSWVEFREEISAASGYLFFTPEYNRSMSGVLKNALDVGSRPPGKGVWMGKPGAVVSVSKGKLGAFGAHHHLRQVLVSLGISAMPKPEAYIGEAQSLFPEDGELVEKTKTYLQDLVKGFEDWCTKFPS